MRRLSSILVFSVVCSFACTAVPAHQRTATNLSPELAAPVPSMVTGVRWCRSGTQGLFRVIIPAATPQEPGKPLAVQILQTDLQGHEVSVLDTVAIAEMAGVTVNTDGLRLRPAENYTCDDALVEGQAVHRRSDGDHAEQFRLRVTSTGQYTVNFTPQ